MEESTPNPEDPHVSPEPLPLPNTWVGTGDRIVLDRHDAAQGVAVVVEPRESEADDAWDGSVTVRLTVSQGFLPDTDEIDLTLVPS